MRRSVQMTSSILFYLSGWSLSCDVMPRPAQGRESLKLCRDDNSQCMLICLLYSLMVGKAATNLWLRFLVLFAALLGKSHAHLKQLSIQSRWRRAMGELFWMFQFLQQVKTAQTLRVSFVKLSMTSVEGVRKYAPHCTKAWAILECWSLHLDFCMLGCVHCTEMSYTPYSGRSWNQIFAAWNWECKLIQAGETLR